MQHLGHNLNDMETEYMHVLKHNTGCSQREGERETVEGTK